MRTFFNVIASLIISAVLFYIMAMFFQRTYTPFEGIDAQGISTCLIGYSLLTLGIFMLLNIHDDIS